MKENLKILIVVLALVMITVAAFHTLEAVRFSPLENLRKFFIDNPACRQFDVVEEFGLVNIDDLNFVKGKIGCDIYEIDCKKADVNKDGVVDNKDLQDLKKKLFCKY
jgi:hypothetical protein